MNKTQANRPIRVAMIADNLERNGIGAYIMGYCSKVDSRLVNLCIIVGGDVDPAYEQVASSANVSIIRLGHRKRHPLRYFAALARTFRQQRFDIVHVHGNSHTMALELALAKLCAVPIRIAHSHNTTCTHRALHRLLTPLFMTSYTQGLACGRLAGQWLFGGRPFSVAPNGIDVAHFLYDQDARMLVRAHSEFTDAFVIGHVGGLNHQKNQAFLIRAFETVAQANPAAVLLLVGEGPDRDKLQEQIQASPYSERILLAGPSQNPRDFYQAMDLFVLPSLFEGLPLALLEAQVAGLPCLVSDGVDPDSFATDRVQTLPLQAGPEAWGQAIVQLAGQYAPSQRPAYTVEQFARIDLAYTAGELTSTYVRCMRQLQQAHANTSR
ncbi:hypothetical protein KIM372_13060 [Bombiscardovia nodaiensis]|uniref:Glycosyltransferase subfamily 4-like N-terminal domain-containing protein n=1 Tax=Bombiscardovia nodaiensis TaxID=2932181 RepID=A0ABM8B924_9BIFI|nr:hypothetical protein KIM372_13060 [Bombiscardovia nodaiensis]